MDTGISASSAALKRLPEAQNRNRHFHSWQQGSAPSLAHQVTLHFCPEGRRCAFVITDHGDRTRLLVSRAVYLGHSDTTQAACGKRGIIASGVRVTQGVFWSGWEGFDYLENADFFALMRDLYEAGSEVCPHNTSEKMELPPEQIRRNLERYAEHFGLSTWIDHYRLPSNLTQQGMNPASEFYILEHFKRLGGRAAWTYRDIFANPPGPQINLLHPPHMSAYARRLVGDLLELPRRRHTIHRIRARLGALALLTLGDKAVGNLLELPKLFRDTRKQARLQEFLRFFKNALRHIQHVLHEGVPLRFPFSWDEASGLYWFDAARILFISEGYNATALNNLIQETGIHIGHTYLGFYGRKYRDRAFRRDGAAFAIREEFQAFLNYLALKIQEGEIWNPTIREMTQYYEALMAVALTERGSGQWRLVNRATTPVTGVTVRSLLPLRVPEGHAAREQRVGQEYWYVIDLRPRAELLLTVP